MILVSFFSEDNALSDEIKIYAIFSNIKVTKIERSAFYGTPRVLESNSTAAQSTRIAPPPHAITKIC